MKKEIIFYSWQSDLPNKDNRNFIKDCIEKAVKSANREEYCLEVDRDTNGISGFPNIQQTILQKIENANVFVADISIVNSSIFNRKRRTPNPNVLFELGFAVKAIGWERVICLFNTDYGEIDDLPFDIKQHRITTYSLKNKEREEEKNRVVGAIKNTLKILVEKGLINNQNAICPEYLFRTATKDILFSKFTNTKIMKCYLNSVNEAEFYLKEGSQGVWGIVGSYNGQGYNFIYDFSIEIDYQTYYVQISCIDLDKDGEKEIVVSIGDNLTDMETLIYNFVPDSVRIFELRGRIWGQEKMYINNEKGTIVTPYGGQGLYEEYVYRDKLLWKKEPDARNKIHR